MRTLLALTVVLLLAVTAQAALTITATLTITNSANLTNAVAISNALLVVNGDTRTYTNSVSLPGSQILITTSLGTNINQILAQTVAHIGLYRFAGLIPSTDGITNIAWRGTNDQAVVASIHPATWGYITYTTQGVPSPTGLIGVAVPATNLPNATATNVYTMVWDALMRFSQNRAWTNVNLGSVVFNSLSVTGLTTMQAGQRISTYGVTNDFSLTTNYYWLGITPTSGPVKITLPSAATTSNQVWIVADEYGAAGTNSITITNAGGDRIRGALSVGISNNFGALFILSRGGTNFSATRWNTLETAGDITTASNLAPGTFTPFDSKSGTALRFNSLTNGAGLSSSSNANVTTWVIATDGVSDAMLRNSAAVSVIGRSANSTGDPADIAAGANFRFLTRESDSLAFRQATLTNYFSDIAWGPISDLDVLVWHAASGKWTNKAVTSTIDTLPELTDVADAFPSLANGDVLMYDSSSGKWTNAVPPGASGGEANTGSNLAPGAFTPYDSKSGVDLRFNALTNGLGLRSSSNANVVTFHLANSIGVDSILVTNVSAKVRQLVSSTLTTNQIDWASGASAYYWTNMVTNVVLQLTNVWTAGVSNRTVDFFFTGATNTGPNFTVTLACPNPAGVNFRWGWNSTTNGNTDLTVTNNQRAGLVLTLWETNLAEAYWSPVR